MKRIAPENLTQFLALCTILAGLLLCVVAVVGAPTAFLSGVVVGVFLSCLASAVNDGVGLIGL